MTPYDQMPKNGRIKVGILLTVAAIAIGFIEIADNGEAIFRSVLDWWRRLP